MLGEVQDAEKRSKALESNYKQMILDKEDRIERLVQQLAMSQRQQESVEIQLRLMEQELDKSRDQLQT